MRTLIYRWAVRTADAEHLVRVYRTADSGAVRYTIGAALRERFNREG